MVRTCQAEQDISDAVDALIKARSPAQVQRVLTVLHALPVAVYKHKCHFCPPLHQVGLLLGHSAAGQRHFIFHTIRTPSFEARPAILSFLTSDCKHCNAGCCFRTGVVLAGW